MTKQEKLALKSASNKGSTEPMPGVQPSQPTTKKVDGKTTARSTRATQRRQATHYLTVPEIQFMQLTVSTGKYIVRTFFILYIFLTYLIMFQVESRAICGVKTMLI